MLGWGIVKAMLTVQVREVLMLNGANPSSIGMETASVFPVSALPLRHSRTPVDEVIGKEFQDRMLEVVNSFFKSPLPMPAAATPLPDPEDDADEDGGTSEEGPEDADMADVTNGTDTEQAAPR
eukprot:jgi/Botrbrau1/11973/Bobra.0115s0009.1